METINEILDKYKKVENKSTRAVNEKWERAQEFGKYVGIPTTVVMRLFKLYGESNTLKIRSWLYDIPYNNNRGGKIALAHWKLKQAKNISK